MKRALLVTWRLAWLPLDLLLLTGDFLRITRWLLQARVWWWFTGAGDAPSPCRRNQAPQATGKDHRPATCRHAERYGSPWLLRFLCPWLDPGEAQGHTVCWCARDSHFRISIVRYVLTGVLLTALWSAAALGARTAYCTLREPSPLRVASRPSPHRVASRPTPPAPVADRAAAQGTRTTSERTSAPASVATPADPGPRTGAYLTSASRLAAAGKLREAMIECRNAIQINGKNATAYVHLGRYARQLNSTNEARKAFNKACELDPDCAPAHLELSRLALSEGDARTALRHANTLCTLLPRDPEAQVQHAACALELGDAESAHTAAEAALRLAPADPKVLACAGRVAAFRSEWDVAERCWQQVLNGNPKDMDARIGMALVARGRGRLAEAIAALKGLLQSDAADVDVQAELADAYVAGGNLKRATDLYRELLTADSTRHFFRGRLAELLILSGQIDEGVKVANELIRDDRKDVTGRLILADLFLRKGMPSLAVEHCRIAIANGAGSLMNANKLLARAYVAAGSYAEALKGLEGMIKVEPKDAGMRLLIGICHRQLGNYEEAGGAFGYAANLDPTAAEPYLQMAHLRMLQKQIDPAVENLRNAMARAPNRPVIMNNLASLLLAHKSDSTQAVAEAYGLAAKAREMMPMEPSIVDTMGWAHYHRGEYTNALLLLSYAAINLPRNAAVRYHLGALQYAQGRFDQARTNLQSALAIAEDFEGARHARKLIEALNKTADQRASGP